MLKKNVNKWYVSSVKNVLVNKVLDNAYFEI